MFDNSLENTVILIFLTLAMIPIALFIVRYFFFSPWRATPEGKTMMYQKIALLSVLTLALLTRTLGSDYWGREILTMAVYGVLVYFFWKTLFELVGVQRKYPFSRVRKCREKRKLK